MLAFCVIFGQMKILVTSLVLLTIVPLAAPAAEENQRVYRWVDKDGVVHFGDSVPVEYVDIEFGCVRERFVECNGRSIAAALLRAARAQAASSTPLMSRPESYR